MASEDKTPKPPTPTESAFEFALPDAPTKTFYQSIPKREATAGREWSSHGHQLTMRENPVPTPIEVPTSSDPADRIIAPLRSKKTMAEIKEQARVEQEKMKVEAEERKEARNEGKLDLLKEQLKRERATQLKLTDSIAELKQDLREEQVTKEAKIREQKATINELQKSIDEVEKRADRNEKAFDGQRELVARQEATVAHYRIQYESIVKEVKKMAENQPKARIKELEETIRGLQEKNEALEKRIANQPTANIEKLQEEKSILRRRNEVLNSDYESLQARFGAAEVKLSEKTDAFRRATNTITTNEVAIRNLERQVEESGHRIANLQQTIKEKDDRIRTREGDFKDKEAEVSHLGSLNETLSQTNTSLKLRNQQLKQHVRDSEEDIEVLRNANRDRDALQIALTEVQTAATQLKHELVGTEQQNNDLKATLEEQLGLGGGGSGGTLQHELTGSGDDHDSDPEDPDRSPGTIKTYILKTRPVVLLKRHNPIDCWLQVYIDLWMLLVLCFSCRLTISFGGRSIISVSHRVIPNGSAATTAFTSTGLVKKKPKAKLPNISMTVLAFCLHILFYIVIIVCATNYRATLHERSTWLAANEITRQYLHKYYKVPFKREYRMLHGLFGRIRWLSVWRYHINNWAKISRALPG